MTNSALREAIDELASLFPYGALKADTCPADFMREVAKEIRTLRRQLETLRGSLLDGLQKSLPNVEWDRKAEVTKAFHRELEKPAEGSKRDTAQEDATRD